MANEMRDAIKGNPIEDIRAVAEAGDAKVAADAVVAAGLVTAHAAKTPAAHAASAISIPASTGAGSVYTAIEVDGALLEIAGATRSNETVKANADAITKLNGMYSIEFVGADADLDAAFCGEISVLTPGAVPAAGDKIIAVISARVTADMTAVAYPAIVDAATSDGFVQILELDYADSKVKVKQGGGSDLSANTYRALVLKV